MRRSLSTLIGFFIVLVSPGLAGAGEPAIAYLNSGTVEVIEVDGSNLTAVYSKEPTYPSRPAPSWSPDFAELVLTDRFQLYRVDVSTHVTWETGWVLAPRDGTFSDGSPYESLSHPAWSPAGGEIAVRTLTPATISLIPEDGGALEPIYHVPSGASLFRGMAWNATGTKIAAFEQIPNGPRQLIVIDRDGNVLQRFSPSDVGARSDWTDPDWARTSDTIAFRAGSERRDRWVYTLDLAAASPQATPVVEGTWPSWGPDDSQIAYRTFNGRLKLIDLATGETQQIGNGAERIDWRRATIECAIDGDCAAGEVCCGATCVQALCEFDSDCYDGDICTDDSCAPCSGGCQNIFDPTNDPSCEEECIPTHNKEKGPRCTDGLDNDCDGLIDSADPDC